MKDKLGMPGAVATIFRGRSAASPLRRLTAWHLLVALAALLALGTALWHLHAATDGLSVQADHAGSIPITVYRPLAPGRAPVVVVAHGFAGSRQLMQPFAITLAQAGYIAVTFDFPGHGRNSTRLAGGITDDKAAAACLLDAVGQVVAYARARPDGDGRIALLGHSMASDTVVQYGRAHPDIDATVAVSAFVRGVDADRPRNLLVIAGALEPEFLHREAERIVGMATAGPVRPDVTYGDMQAGTARRLAYASGAEHVGVLYSHDSLQAARDWLDANFHRSTDVPVESRGPWLALLFSGLVALGWPLAALLPVLADPPAGAGLPWRRLLPVLLLPAIATPLLLRPLPPDLLPLLLGDYLALHLGVYGLLMLAGLAWLRVPLAGLRPSRPVLAAAAGIAAWGVLGIGLPIDAYFTSFIPTGERLLMLPLVLAGTLPWFVADEWLTRGAAAPRGAYVASKACLLVSLALAIGLNLPRLYFLIIIMPVIVMFFLVYGLFSAWSWRATRHPLPAALANAASLAWAIAATFPMIAH
jgi:alpha/beta superfamily hydrolase